MKKLLYLHPSWHDKEENTLGKLTSLISTDVEHLKYLTGIYTAVYFQAIGGFVIGIAVALLASWKLTLFTMLILPFFAALQIIMVKHMKG